MRCYYILRREGKQDMFIYNCLVSKYEYKKPLNNSKEGVFLMM